jgi:hypothetical protein
MKTFNFVQFISCISDSGANRTKGIQAPACTVEINTICSRISLEGLEIRVEHTVACPLKARRVHSEETPVTRLRHGTTRHDTARTQTHTIEHANTQKHPHKTRTHKHH